MSARRPFTLIAGAIFALMSLIHLYRLAAPFEVTIGPCHVPQWLSAVAAAVAGLLSAMLFRESRA